MFLLLLIYLCFVNFFLDNMDQDEENAKAISLFEDIVHLNDAIEDEGKRLENLVRGVFAGNIFDLGSAQVGYFSILFQ